MDEQYIQRALGWHFGIERGYIPIPNVLMYGGLYEADFVYINKNNYNEPPYCKYCGQKLRWK